MTGFTLLNILIYVCVGVVAYVLALAFVAKLARFDFAQRIAEERNVPAAIVAAAVALGLAWIIASSVH
ncbi:MAG: DUF350 domain-containing protein [Bryobacteraceae bacterium]|jgi:uncharacterized membrane protein YjfL (UPF0719 family)